jgi:hypothetical protein
MATRLYQQLHDCTGFEPRVQQDDDPERLHPVTPQPHAPPRSRAAAPQWDGWPYDEPSDDEEYGENVPAWRDSGADELLSLSENDSDGNDSDGNESDGGEGGDGGGGDGAAAEEDDDEENQIYDFGEFYDPFNRRMLVDADSDSDMMGGDDEDGAAGADGESDSGGDGGAGQEATDGPANAQAEGGAGDADEEPGETGARETAAAGDMAADETAAASEEGGQEGAAAETATGGAEQEHTAQASVVGCGPSGWSAIEGSSV